jgi:NADH dehydrogenase, FAD-containing subunit
MASSHEAPRHLVLVGGGHSHVEVLREWAHEPVPGVRLSVVSDGPRAVYSGMVPGFVAGQYRLAEIEIDVEALPGRRARHGSTRGPPGSTSARGGFTSTAPHPSPMTRCPST